MKDGDKDNDNDDDKDNENDHYDDAHVTWRWKVHWWRESEKWEVQEKELAPSPPPAQHDDNDDWWSR